MAYHRIELNHEVSIRASAQDVYNLVSDITRTGEWSAECVQAVWTKGEPGVVGSQFVGSNYERNAETGQEWRWDMTCEVLEARAPKTFVWSVLTEAWDHHTSIWSYEIVDLEDSVLLRHTYRMKRPPKGWQPILDRHDHERQLELVQARRQRLDRGMQATLDALAEYASQEPGSARFDLQRLFGAIDAKRQRQELSWAALAREVGVATSTIRRFAEADDAEADGVLSLVRWLDDLPEDYVSSDSVKGTRLRPGDGYVRVDMELFAKASGDSGGPRGRTRTSIQRLVEVAQESGQPVASLTRFSDV